MSIEERIKDHFTEFWDRGETPVHLSHKPVYVRLDEVNSFVEKERQDQKQKDAKKLEKYLLYIKTHPKYVEQNAKTILGFPL